MNNPDPLHFDTSIQAMKRNIERQRELIQKIELFLGFIKTLGIQGPWSGVLKLPGANQDFTIPFRIITAAREELIAQYRQAIEKAYEDLKQLQKEE